MLLDLLTANDPKQLIISILLTVPIVMISLSVHEAAHAYIAYKMGDPTARNLGRLTINPMKHLDLVGSLMMLFVGYGWAKPVPINTRYFKNPKKGMALTALAGPVSNLILAFIGLICYVATCFLQIELESTSIYFWVIETHSRPLQSQTAASKPRTYHTFQASARKPFAQDCQTNEC